MIGPPGEIPPKIGSADPQNVEKRKVSATSVTTSRYPQTA